ncbi:MAG: DUF4956 domain-containing protein [Candidatus Gygaella obscura]|nr:DUF4956 domain-containing protein [Candidatus Gygaella obscura]
MNKLLKTIDLYSTTATGGSVSISILFINFIFVVLLAYVLRWFYIKYGNSLSNRRLFANIFPILSTTTFLVIFVVKSSLALSLGLVGALSIVRFRTPIKEPEELAYLFMSIAIGLGIGADQTVATVLIICSILVTTKIHSVYSKRKYSCNVYLNIEINKKGLDSSIVKQIERILSKYVNIVDLRRLDSREGFLALIYYIDCKNEAVLKDVFDKLNNLIPGANISFIDHDREVIN